MRFKPPKTWFRAALRGVSPLVPLQNLVFYRVFRTSDGQNLVFFEGSARKRRPGQCLGAQAPDRMRFSMDRGGGERPGAEKHGFDPPSARFGRCRKNEKNTGGPIWSQKADQQRQRRRHPSRWSCFTRVSAHFRESGGAAPRKQGRTSSGSDGGGSFHEAQKPCNLRCIRAFRWLKPRVFQGSARKRRQGQCLRGVGRPKARQHEVLDGPGRRGATGSRKTRFRPALYNVSPRSRNQNLVFYRVFGVSEVKNTVLFRGQK